LLNEEINAIQNSIRMDLAEKFSIILR